MASLPLPPQLHLSLDGLTNACPLLKATYLECNRLHSQSISARNIEKDIITAMDTSQNAPTGSPAWYLLQKRSYLQIPGFLHHTSPKYFFDPNVFRPERFLSPNLDSPSGQLTVNSRTLRPYGGGASICKGRFFAETEALAFVGGFLALWDLEPVEGNVLKIPCNLKGSASAKPRRSLRVATIPRMST